MTPTLAQVLALRVKLYPTIECALPVLDPKMQNKGQSFRSHCHTGPGMGSKTSFHQPSTRNPHCKSYKGRTPRISHMSLVKMLLLLHDKVRMKIMEFFSSCSQDLMLSTVLKPAASCLTVICGLAPKVFLHSLFCFLEG